MHVAHARIREQLGDDIFYVPVADQLGPHDLIRPIVGAQNDGIARKLGRIRVRGRVRDAVAFVDEDWARLGVRLPGREGLVGKENEPFVGGSEREARSALVPGVVLAHTERIAVLVGHGRPNGPDERLGHGSDSELVVCHSENIPRAANDDWRNSDAACETGPNCGTVRRMRVTAILFDLDGTLTDPKLGITRSMRYALERLQAKCPTDEELASFIGPPLRGTFAALLETHEVEKIERAMLVYRERFGDVGLFENAVYEGIEEMLVAARDAGTSLYVATSKPTVYASRIVEHFGLGMYFDGIYGSELSGRFEHKTELLAHLLMAEGIPAHEAVMVGDRAQDVIAARVNGVTSIGVTWGYGTEVELVDAGADRICHSPRDLLRTVTNPAP